MVFRKRVLATQDQIDAAIGALDAIPDKPAPLTRDEIVKRLAPSIHRLSGINYSNREIVDLVNKAQGENNFITISVADVRKVLAEQPAVKRRGRRRKAEADQPAE